MMSKLKKEKAEQKYIIFSVVTGLFLLFFSSTAFSQTGIIKGKVMDAETEELLIGAVIRIEGYPGGATSDGEGNFIIKELPEGTYTLNSSYFSYKPFTKEKVIVHKKEITEVVITLSSDAVDLGEIEVVAKVNREAESVLLLQQKNAIISMQSIGAQELSRKGISDAESAVAKVAGVSKQEGVKNVFIRGLEDRYNTTLLNGLPLPSEDPEYKNIALEIFGTDIIQNIGVNKVFSANHTGDVGGAIITIHSKEILKDQELSVSLSSGINTEVMGERFSKSSGVNYLGVANAKRPLENQFNFSNGLDPSVVKLPINQNYKIAGGKRFKLKSNALSVFGVLNHKTDFSYTEEIIRNTNTAGIIYKNQTGSKYSNTISQLAFANVKYDINNKHFIAYNFMTFHTNHQYVGEYTGIDTEKFQDSESNTGYVRRQQINDNLLLVHQLLSKWKLTEKLSLSADLSFNSIKGSEPDRRENYLSQKNNGTYGLTGSNRQKRFFSELSQKDFASKIVVDYQLKDAHDNKFSKLTIGYNGYSSVTDFGAIEYNFSAVPTSSTLDNIHLDDIYNATNYQAGKFTMTEGTPNTYKVSKNTYSGFAEGTYQLTKSLIGSLGFRLDYVNMNVSYDITGLRDSNSIVKPYSLPSLNLKYSLNEKNALRLGISKTYTLPQSKEISPYQYTDIGFSSEGNPNLQASDNYNTDLKWDYYLSRSEILSVTVFYKHILNPIGRVDKGNSAGLLTYENISKTNNLLGAELEFRKNLIQQEKNAKSSNSNLSLGVNASYIFSALQLELVNTPVRRSSLEGSSPFIANTDLTYRYSKNENSLMTALIFNYFSDRIHTNGTMGFKDIIEKGVASLDVVFAYAFKNKWEVKLKAANVLNPSFTLVRESSISSEEIILNQYKKGIIMNLGVSFTL